MCIVTCCATIGCEDRLQLRGCMVQPFSDAALHDANLAHKVVRREDAALGILAGLADFVVLGVVDVVARSVGVLGR
eukprot:16369947-Heterocapsa_arctica.AAC.1